MPIRFFRIKSRSYPKAWNKSSRPTRMGGFILSPIPYSTSYDQQKYKNQERLVDSYYRMREEQYD
jgi:hypothetical protein